MDLVSHTSQSVFCWEAREWLVPAAVSQGTVESGAQLSSTLLPTAPALALEGKQEKLLAGTQAGATSVSRPTEMMLATDGISATQHTKRPQRPQSRQSHFGTVQSCPGGGCWPRARSLCSLPYQWHLNTQTLQKKNFGALFTWERRWAVLCEALWGHQDRRWTPSIRPVFLPRLAGGSTESQRGVCNPFPREGTSQESISAASPPR